MWTAIKNNNDTDYSGKYYDPSHPEGISDNGATLGEYELNGYEYAVGSFVTNSEKVPKVSSTIADNAKSIIFGESGLDYAYWLASRGVYAGGVRALFGPARVDHGIVRAYSHLLFSAKRYYEEDSYCPSCLRPLISLTVEIPASVE